MNINPMLLADFYKTSHMAQYPKGTEYVFANWIPRTSRMPGVTEVMSFGQQAFISKWLIDFFNVNFFRRSQPDILKEYERFMSFTIGPQATDSKHIAALHDLGYLPLTISALPEGTMVPIGVPMLTIENTEPEFFWLVNYVETLISCELWMPMTSATIAHEYRKILDAAAIRTTGSTDGVQFQGHDFSMRGMAGVDAAMLSGMGHLVSFVGTDTMPAICALEAYYGANIEKELIGCSIPATEHSVQCVNGTRNLGEETAFMKRLITEIYPSGLVSMVSDTINLWDLLSIALPELKEDVMARDGKFVVRPDSGDPVDILCGTSSKIKYFTDADELNDFLLDCHTTEIFSYKGGFWEISGDDIQDFIEVYGKDQWNQSVDARNLRKMSYETAVLMQVHLDVTPESKGVVEILWNIFGGTINEKGFKVLDPHIGAIYGDSITLERAQAICDRLKAKGFASTNVVLGIGSYSYQYNTRDTFGFAMKTTWAQVSGKEHQVFKNPITDDGTKKSLKGLCIVSRDGDGKLVVEDQMNANQHADAIWYDELKCIFHNGMLIDPVTITEVRERASR